MRSLALTPTWSLATVLTILVVVSLIVERSIHRLCSWLRETDRKPLLAAVEKMKEELMLLGFISLLLTANSSTIANICIPSKFYEGNFASCTGPETDEEIKQNSSEGRKLGYEPFLSYQDLERLHRFIFLMAITHISYSCLTMLLAIVKIHSWRAWEDLARKDCHGVSTENNREKTLRRQTTFARHHTSSPSVKNSFLIWVNHKLSLKYDFHSYMIRSTEEEFQRIVDLISIFWISVVPITVLLSFTFINHLYAAKGIFLGRNKKYAVRNRHLEGQQITRNEFCIAKVIALGISDISCHGQLVVLVGAKLQHVIATLTLETAGLTTDTL
ncbi:MLO-like protein 11 isoform X4 [Populus alba x Populus x berolinensis]|uniref:MLO-like protein 11 isoform X4 n=1 Tax=Populus alba x Populus x berolinensis TaxID=444605 RepID=A0AAD6M7A6_9ROSI|nr:MLO-like protein 11 isoform X4 [Populus alba x Populus x berolinensis]